MAERPKEPLEQQTLAPYFALAGAILVICTAVSLIQEFWWRRPFKTVQREFRRVASAELAGQLSTAVETAEKAKGSAEYQAAMKAYETARATARSEEVQQKRDALQKEMAESETELALVRSELRVMRGEYQEAIYHLEEGDSHAKAKVQALDPQVETMAARMLALDGKRKELKGRLHELEKPVIDATAALAVFDEDVQVLRRRKTAVESTEIGVKQIFNEEIALVDRCTSCHLGVSVPGLERLPDQHAEFRTHPSVKDPLTGESVDLLEVHDISKIGCTPCHQGQGFATTHPEEAHGYGHHWTEPLLSAKDPWAPGLNSATCLKCHQQEVNLAGADVLMKGKRLVKELGCWGCHKIKGIGEEYDRLASAEKRLEEVAAKLASVKKGFDAKVEAGQKDFDLGPTRRDKEALAEAELLEDKARHEVDELQLEVRRIAPSLKQLKDKVYPGWLPLWVKNPKKWRPSTKMPNFFPELEAGFYTLEDAESLRMWQEEEMRAISAFIWQNADGEGLAAPEPVPPKADVSRGKELFEAVGCKACHRIGDDPETPGNTYGPELTRIGEKARMSWLAEWIEYPRKMMHDAKMPSLRLSSEEARLIAAYLSTQKQAETPEKPDWLEDKSLFDRGHALVDRYGCFSCHEIKGMEYGKGKVGTELSSHGRKLVEEFDFGLFERQFRKDGRHSRQGWISRKLESPRFFDKGRYRKPEDRLKMPDFGLEPDEVAAITTFLLGQTGEPFHPGYVYRPDERKAAILEGWRLVEKFNCTTCHEINGHGGFIRESYGPRPEDLVFAPPILQGEGRKVQSDWLIRFLKAPVQLRPFLKVKMPTFDMSEAEAIALAEFFAALDGEEYPFHHEPVTDLSEEQLAAAKEMFTTFQCLRCHQAGAEELSPDEAANKAPDLLMAGRRLKRDWVLRWLHNPDALQQDTRMPSFWQGGTSMLPHILGGDADEQMQIMRDFVMELKVLGGDVTKPAPPGESGDSMFFEEDEEEEEDE